MPRMHEGTLHGNGLKFAVIATRFHEAIVERLLEGAIECLERHGVSSEAIDVYRVPGAFEIPFMASQLTQKGRVDAVISIGVLVRGDTPHFDFISSQVTTGISRASVESGVPIAFGVITCNTIEQAQERTVPGNNKGWEAALAAIEMATLLRSVRRGDGVTGRRGEKSRRTSPRPPVSPSPRRKGGR